MSNCKAYSAHPALALEQLQCAELFKNQQQQQHRRHNSSNVLSRKISTHSPDVATLGNQSPIHEIILPERTFGGHNDIDVDADADNADDYLTEGGHNYAVIDEDELITTTTTTKDCVNCANNFNDNEIGGHDNVDVSCCTRKPIRSTTMTTSKSHDDDDDDDNDDGRIRNSQSPYRVSLNRHHLTQLQQHLALGDIDVDGVVAAGRTGCLSGVSSTISSPSASTVSTPLSTPTRLPLDYTPHHYHHNHHHQFQHNHLHQHHQVPKCNHHYSNKNNYKLENSSALAGIVLMGGAAGTATPTSTTTTTTTTTTGTTTITLTPQLSKSLLETSKNQQPHPQHYHHQHHNFHHSASSSSSSSTSSPINKNNNSNINNNNGCKKIKKFDPRLGPSPYRQLLPIALCILSFAVVFSLLIIYMDTTEIRHQQFRLNMSRDYDMYSVVQDDPQLIAFLREIHMRKYPMHFLKSRTDDGIITTTTTTTTTTSTTITTNNNGNNIGQQRFNFNAAHDKSDLAPLMARYVSNLVGNKLNTGSVIQSLPGSLSHLLTAPWLAETLNWAGLIVEPEPRRFFALRKQNQQNQGMQVMHACVSPTAYPKEVPLHNEDTDVRINSLLDEETSWFNSRVKCFPLYTIMLACNRTQYDLLSLGVHGHELEILQTLPFEKLQIEVISIHLPEDHEDARNGSSQQYIQAITQYLALKNYKMQRTFGRNYFYQRQHYISSRTRKKDILLLKTP